MELAKNILFNSLILIGLIVICLALILLMLIVIDKITGYSKMAVEAAVYKRKKKEFDSDLENEYNLIVSRMGYVQCNPKINDLDKQIEILEKAISLKKMVKQRIEENKKERINLS